MAQKDSDWFIESKWERVGSMVCEAVGLRSLSTSPTGAPGAPYFLKVYELSGPEVHGHALTCAEVVLRLAQAAGAVWRNLASDLLVADGEVQDHADHD
jgi:hypothetical protein